MLKSWRNNRLNLLAVIIVATVLNVGAYDLLGPWPAVGAQKTQLSEEDHLPQIDEHVLSELNESVRQNPGDAKSLIRRGEFWFDNQRYDEAIKDYRGALGLDPDDADIQFRLRSAYYARADWRLNFGRTMEAINDYNELIRLDPQAVVPYIVRGHAWFELDRHDRAIADYTTALRLRPEKPNSEALEGRGTVYLYLGQCEKALADFNQFVQIRPQDDTGYDLRGLVWIRKREYEKAIADFTIPIQRYEKIDHKNALDSPGLAHVDYYLQRAIAHYGNGDYQAALRDLDSVLADDPHNLKALNIGAWLRATCPDQQFLDGASAIRMATKACAHTRWKNPVYLETLAAAYAEFGDFAKAIKLQEKAIQSAGRDRIRKSAHVRLGLYRKHESHRAKNIYEMHGGCRDASVARCCSDIDTLARGTHPTGIANSSPVHPEIME